MKVLIPFLTLLFVVVVGFSRAEDTLISSQTHQKDLIGNCSYLINIYTSCYSPRRTRDHISLAFGDKYGHQVYVPRMDELPSAKLDRCITKAARCTGPCTSQICYMYIYRNGDDGWKPHDITVSGNFSKPFVFYFNTLIPNHAWFGFNFCKTSSLPSSATA
ncbi:hypothetical protein QN277_011028 [Acacia crassicarpa]|uniref:Uncharacterized protein n=1 Tax=Acacia crassicarpa TaxID=499986 RepID=A0AAE1M5U8_9FABA|nr:hypothetical protein QN277_011028 [Acacia crassicarpa]